MSIRAGTSEPGASANAFDRWFFQRAPASRLAAIRLLVGAFCVAYLLIRSAHVLTLASNPAARFHPVGPVSVLSSPLPAPVHYAVFGLTLLAGLAFTLGWRYRITGPAFALLATWVFAYRCSWGMIFHTEHLLTLQLLVVGFSPAADALSLDARDRPPPALDGRHGWPLRLLAVATVIAYLLAGIAKLRVSGLEWMNGDILRLHVAYDNLRKIELGDWHSPIGVVLVRYPWLFPPLAWLSVVLEMGAPLALLHPRLGKLWALGIWSFHVGVLAMMWILFAYPLSFLPFLCFFEPEHFFETGRGKRMGSWLRGEPPD